MQSDYTVRVESAIVGNVNLSTCHGRLCFGITFGKIREYIWMGKDVTAGT